MGLDTVIPQAIGAGRITDARRALGAGLRLALLVGAAATLAVLASPALAQDVASGASVLQDLWGIVSPLVMLLVSIVGPALVAWVAVRLVAVLNVNDEKAKKDIEAKVRDALHLAALNGLKFAMTKVGLPSGSLPSQQEINDAMAYVRSKNPDASADIDDNDLEEIVMSKVPDLIRAVR